MSVTGNFGRYGGAHTQHATLIGAANMGPHHQLRFRGVIRANEAEKKNINQTTTDLQREVRDRMHHGSQAYRDTRGHLVLPRHPHTRRNPIELAGPVDPSDHQHPHGRINAQGATYISGGGHVPGLDGHLLSAATAASMSAAAPKAAAGRGRGRGRGGRGRKRDDADLEGLIDDMIGDAVPGDDVPLDKNYDDDRASFVADDDLAAELFGDVTPTAKAAPQTPQEELADMDAALFGEEHDEDTMPLAEAAAAAPRTPTAADFATFEEEMERMVADAIANGVADMNRMEREILDYLQFAAKEMSQKGYYDFDDMHTDGVPRRLREGTIGRWFRTMKKAYSKLRAAQTAAPAA